MKTFLVITKLVKTSKERVVEADGYVVLEGGILELTGYMTGGEPKTLLIKEWISIEEVIATAGSANQNAGSS